MSPPFVVLAGPPKTGKSTAALKTFQNSFYLLNAKSNAHYFRKCVRQGLIDTHKYRHPKKYKLLSPSAVGVTETPYSSADEIVVRSGQPAPFIQEFESTIQALMQRTSQAHTAGEPIPYNNLVIDEGLAFWQRAFEEILPSCVSKSGNVDQRQAYGEVGRWSTKICTWLRELVDMDVGVCVVLHDKEPDDATAKKGGPKLVSQSIETQLCAISDGAIQRIMRDPKDGDVDAAGNPIKKVRYQWNATPGENWNRGFRGLTSDDADIIADMELEEIVSLADYDLFFWPRQSE